MILFTQAGLVGSQGRRRQRGPLLPAAILLASLLGHSLLRALITGPFHSWTSLVAQRLKRLPPMRETRVQSLGWVDPLEKEMVTHSSLENPMGREAS